MCDSIVDIIQNRAHKLVIISGETGSGKSTQIPQFLLENALNNNRACNIVCTQPRRISAISIASRVGKEMSDPDQFSRGSLVGYQVRHDAKIGDSTRLTFCTIGILLRRLESDPELLNVSHVIVDEVHERSSESDFLLYLLRILLAKRNDLRYFLY
jgi:ATP-dependent RNA helicase DHX29